MGALKTSRGFTTKDAQEIRSREGFNEVTEKKPNWFISFLRRFWGLSAWMIELVVVISLVLHRLLDAIIALVLLVINALVIFFAELRSEHAVSVLRKRLQISTRTLRDGLWQLIPARELVPGDVVRIRLGDIVPADIEIVEGSLEVDQSALTGESIFVSKKTGDSVFSGSLVRRGECIAQITAIGAKTYFGQTIELLKSAKPTLHLDEIVGKLARYLLLVVGILLVISLVFTLFKGISLTDFLPLCLVLLMGALPIALPVMFSVSAAVATRRLFDRGVLVTRLSAAEDAATMDTLCIDKTGTVTEGRMSVVAIIPAPHVDYREVLQKAAMASEANNADPIDVAILSATNVQGVNLSEFKVESFIPFSPETRRTEAILVRGSQKLHVSKGSVPDILTWANDSLHTDFALMEAKRQASLGRRSIAVSEQLDGIRKFLGLIALEDPPRADSKPLIDSLRKLSVRVIMLTGDFLPVAEAIASEIGLGRVTKESDVRKNELYGLLQESDGLAEVYPETKYRIINELQAHHKIVGMTGDGINDAPSLRKAEVGIAVSTATDVAKAAASVVLTQAGLSGIIDLIANGRAVFQRNLTWMINKISRTIFKTGFVVFALLLTGKLVITAIAMLLIMLLMDFAKISLATDHVHKSLKPNSWDIGPMAGLGALLGVLMIFEGLFIFFIAIHYFSLSVESAQLQTFTFLLMLFMAPCSLLSVRERRRFWSSRPSNLLLVAVFSEASLGLLIAVFGIFDIPPLPLELILLGAAGSALFSLIVNDFIKYAYLRHCNT